MRRVGGVKDIDLDVRILIASNESPDDALSQWIDLFVDFLATKHGLAAAMRSDHAGFEALHTYFLDRLVPVCAELLNAAARDNKIRADVNALELMRAVGNLCVSIDGDSGYDPHRMARLLIAGLRRGMP